jgi:hypothetical protein
MTVPMGKINVYLPDDLEAEVKAAGIAVSAVCQEALRSAVDRIVGARAGDAERGGFTPRLAAIVEARHREMQSRGRAVEPYDLVCGIIKDGENLGARLLRSFGIELPEPAPVEARATTDVQATEATRGLLEAAAKVALELKHAWVGCEHVVIAAAEGADPLHADMYRALGVTPRLLRDQLERFLANPWSTATVEPEPDQGFMDRIESELHRLADEVRELKEQRRDT